MNIRIMIYILLSINSYQIYYLMKLILPCLSTIEYAQQQTPLASTKILSELQTQLRQSLPSFKRIEDFFLVTKDIDLIIDVTPLVEEAYVVERKVYQDMRVQKMVDPTFKITEYLQKLKQPIQNKKRENKREEKIAKQEESILNPEAVTFEPQQQKQILDHIAMQQMQIQQQYFGMGFPSQTGDIMQWQQQYQLLQPQIQSDHPQLGAFNNLDNSSLKVQNLVKSMTSSQAEKSLIQKLKDAVFKSTDSIHQISQQMGIKAQIIRLMMHEKLHVQSSTHRQPFRFLKHKYFPSRGSQLKISEEIKEYYAQNAVSHQSMSYEDRCRINLGSPNKISYFNLKQIYKQFQIPKEQYKEKGKNNEALMGCSADQQINQLLALELSDLKLRKDNIYYIDALQVKQQDIQLTLSQIDMAAKVNESESKGNNNLCWVVICIESSTGIVGFQIVKERPDINLFTIFMRKLVDKIIAKNLSNEEQAPNNWVVIRQQHIANSKSIEVELDRACMRVLPTFNEDQTVKFNCVSGVWQYIAQLWELKFNKSDVFTESTPPISETMNACIRELDSKCIKAIAETYNNSSILTVLSQNGTITTQQQSEPYVIHEKW